MGLMSKYVIEVYALSGVVVRANDFRKDLRLVGYSYYSRIEFNVVVGIKGDSMDRNSSLIIHNEIIVDIW